MPPGPTIPAPIAREADGRPALWVCNRCGWVYDPAQGDGPGGVPPGLPFEHLPEAWTCPNCGAEKDDFIH
ncbi:MAG: rubredoxin [Pseudomonadota bacterium]